MFQCVVLAHVGRQSHGFLERQDAFMTYYVT